MPRTSQGGIVAHKEKSPQVKAWKPECEKKEQGLLDDFRNYLRSEECLKTAKLIAAVA